MSRTFPSLLLVATTALAGCTTQAAYIRPTVEAPTAWFNAPASAVSAAGATSPERWWTVLNDPAINGEHEDLWGGMEWSTSLSFEF